MSTWKTIKIDGLPEENDRCVIVLRETRERGRAHSYPYHQVVTYKNKRFNTNGSIWFGPERVTEYAVITGPIKACPWCKSDDMRFHVFDGVQLCAMRCMGCGACGPEAKTEQEARDNWGYEQLSFSMAIEFLASLSTKTI